MENVQRNLLRRMQACIMMDGDHLKNFFFRPFQDVSSKQSDFFRNDFSERSKAIRSF